MSHPKGRSTATRRASTGPQAAKGDSRARPNAPRKSRGGTGSRGVKRPDFAGRNFTGMTTLVERVLDARRNRRYSTHAQTMYWVTQWRQLAEDAIYLIHGHV